MLKEKSKIKVHFYDGIRYPEILIESKGEHNNIIYEVKNHSGTLGIDWNTRQSPYTCNGDIFTPFKAFAQNVIFEDIESGKLYYFSNITNKLEEKEAQQ